MGVRSLHEAKKAKKDEFYTKYCYIEEEIQHYTKHFKDKIVYCPCDDYRFSNFIKYFKDNYHCLGLRKLIATNYDIGNGAYRYEYDGQNETITPLQGNGDFRSLECTEIYHISNIIVTNPPFSLFKEFITWLFSEEKQFIILGNANAVTYKDTFKLIMNGKMWSGYNFMRSMDYVLPDWYDKWHAIVDGCRIRHMANSGFYTNIPILKDKTLTLTKQYDPDLYPKYDNYDAINVDKIKDIPYDYYGTMGVPISILSYNLDNFEVVGKLVNGSGTEFYDYGSPYIGGGARMTYARVLIRRSR